MEILGGLRFLKKRFMSIFDYRTKWNGKLLVGSFAIVLLLMNSMIAIQISNKTVSEQNMSIDNLGEIEGNDNCDNTMNKTTHEMSDIEDYEERGSDESIQSSETEEDYYMMSTSLTAEEVEQFAAEIKNDILKYNWDALAEKISYPIVISGITVNNREDFLKLDIDGNLNQKFVEAISAETCRKMFSNWQGVMMGATGQIWFGNVDNGKGTSELLIIEINDMLDAQMSSIGS